MKKLWGSFKWSNICESAVHMREKERTEGEEILEEIMATILQLWWIIGTLNKGTQWNNIKHIQKNKDEMERSDFYSDTMQPRQQWIIILKTLPNSYSNKNNKTFKLEIYINKSNMQKLKQFITRLVLQSLWKDLLQEGNDTWNLTP